MEPRELGALDLKVSRCLFGRYHTELITENVEVDEFLEAE